MFNMTSKYFSTFSYKPRASWVKHWTRYFLHAIPVCIIVPCYNWSFWNIRKNSLPVRGLPMSYKLFCLWFCVSSDQWKHCEVKTLQGIWETFLYENHCSYNSYKFSYKFPVIPFLSFSRSQKQESNF